MSNQTSYERVTRVILDTLREGVVPWRQTWASNPPQSVRGHHYRGINALVTSMVALRRGYDDPRWITFRHARERGGHVRKGEKSTSVLFWTWCERRAKPAKDRGEGEGGERFAVARVYRVFNVAQCEGLDLAPWAERPALAPLDACERLVARYRGGAPVFEAGAPAYVPAIDRIRIPPRDAFESSEAYYATLFHELTHSTGHASRLARPAVMDVAAFASSHDYGKEELVAELGAAFLCARAGIAAKTLHNAASYLDHWLGVLEADPSLLVGAAQHAQHAADWIADDAPALERAAA
ncbi:MAG: zincin-like metallopeptidase domain-containing protein [Polyangiaceae bacterium]